MSWVRLDRAFEALQGVRHAGTIVGPAMASVAVSVMLTPAPAQISHRRLLCARLLRLRFLYLIACRDLWLTAFKDRMLKQPAVPPRSRCERSERIAPSTDT